MGRRVSKQRFSGGAALRSLAHWKCAASPLPYWTTGFSQRSPGAILWSIVEDFALLLVGMAIIGVPIYLVALLLRGNAKTGQPPRAT